MKRIFLDTNFVIDYLIREEYKPLCQDFLEKGTIAGHRFYISALTIANFAYIARKLDNQRLYVHLKNLSQIFEVVDLTAADIERAISMRANDFEDALQYRCAVSNQCTVIITRNGKDFAFSDIPVMPAEEYMGMYL